MPLPTRSPARAEALPKTDRFPSLPRYRALGTEPFWAASIAGDRLSVAQPDRPSQSFRISLTEKGAIRRFNGEGVAMTVSPGPCQDGMGDAIYPDRVQLSLGDQILKGCGGDHAEREADN